MLRNKTTVGFGIIYSYNDGQAINLSDEEMFNICSAIDLTDKK